MRTLSVTLALACSALRPPSARRRPRTIRRSEESPYVSDLEQPPGPHATKWLATSENNDQWIEFDERHYRSMYADMTRTEMFTQTLEKKLSKFPPKTAVVCDLGTGPYLLFAKAAAAAGARKVYAIEAVPGSQKKARQELQMLEQADNSGVEPGVIELVCGFSTDVELPEKVDILISEIAGSIASEEGVYATIKDARERFVKAPRDPESFVPFSYETWGAPGTDLCHHSGGAQSIPNDGTALRIDSQDDSMQLLSDPVRVEDIQFSGELPADGIVQDTLAWTVDPARIAANERTFGAILGKDREAIEANGLDVERLARDVSRSLTGIALWPTIVFEPDRSVVYETRGPRGEMRLSHWPTVLPPLRERPLLVAPGTQITAAWTANLRDGKPSTPLEYSLECDTRPPSDPAAGEAATVEAAARLAEAPVAEAPVAQERWEVSEGSAQWEQDEADLAALKKARDDALRVGWAASGQSVSADFMAAAASAPRAGVPADFVAADWVSALDEASGKTYYYNAQTGASSWVWPPV